MPPAEVAQRDLDFFVDRVTQLLATTLIAERNASLAGFAAWRGSVLVALYVAPDFRGSDLATNLMRATEQEMAGEGILEGELHCVIGNDRARRFYERLGWHHKDKLVETLPSAGPDAEVRFWRMTKALGSW